MLAAAEHGAFDVLIVDDLSRLSRDAAETQQCHKRLQYWDVGLVAVSDGIDTVANPRSGGLLLGIKGAMNEEYLRDLGDKTRRGLQGQVSRGFSPGGLPYGYRSEPIYDGKVDRYGKPEPAGYRRVIVEEQTQVVRRIFRMAAHGEPPLYPRPMTSREIAEVLNAEGVPSPGLRWGRHDNRKCDRGWSYTAIIGDRKRGLGILNNQLYVGREVLNRSEWRKDPNGGRGKTGRALRRPRIRPESEWVIDERPELRIVSDEAWQAVKAHQEQRSLRTRNYALTKYGRAKYLLSGFVKCGTCGASYVLRGRTVYGCCTPAYRGKGRCTNGMTVNREVLERIVLNAVRDELYRRDCIQVVIDAADKRLRELTAGSGNGDRPKELRKQLRQVEAEIDNVIAAIKQGIVTKSTKAELKALEARQARLESALAQANNPVTARLDSLLADLPQRVKALVDDMRPLLENGGASEAKANLATVLDEVELRPARTKEGLPYLIARLKGSLKRIIPLLAKRDDANLVVAGAGFEPATFGL